MNANRNTLRKQEEIQEKARQTINDKTTQAMSKIDGLASVKEQTPGEARKATIARRTSTVVTKGKGHQSHSLAGPSIEEKVMKLLNSMQVVSEHIDVEMANLNIHLP